MPRVAALLYSEALASSVTLPAEILTAAAQLAKARRRPADAASFELLHIDDEAAQAASTGVQLSASRSLEELEACDLLLLPAIWRRPARVLQRFAPWHDKLRALYEQGSAICSVGSASNLMAATGLLDQLPATTHWHDFDAFAQRHPQVDLKRRHLMTRAGNLYCVGSVNSIADFMVHMVSQWYGDGIARGVEAQFSPEARQNFETAAFLAEAPESHHDAVVRELQDFLHANLEARHDLASLAMRVDLSGRSLHRRFHAATDRSPMAYLRQIRLREARSLLKHSDLAITEIAWRCGFGSPSRFSAVFSKDQGMSPRQFRAALRGKRFAQVPARGAT